MKDGKSAPADRDGQPERAAHEQPPLSGPATVEAVTGPRGVMLAVDGARFLAELAAAGYDAPRPGDRVLYFTDEAGGRYVIGVLARGSRRSVLDAILERDEPPAPALVRDPDRNATVLRVPDGDLVIDVPNGAIRINGRRGVDVESDGTLKLRSARAAILEAGPGDGSAARVEVQPGEVTVAASALLLAAERAELLAARLSIRAKRFETHVVRMKQVADVVETQATRIVERARDVYREVTELSQLRAGRVRWVAEKTATLVSEDVLLKARGRMKVKGERIHLA